MDRRHFLFSQLSLAVSASLLTRKSMADSMSGHMDMGQMSSMENMPHAMSMSASNTAVNFTLPSGQSLTSLWKLPNHSTKAGVFKATITAAPKMVEFVPGKQTEVWCYEGHVPGPLIEVNEGDTVEIEFVNQLKQPSTMHWHGLSVPATQDGNPADLVQPGQSRIYRFTLPIGSAGTYWYHPHPHHFTAEQAFRGMAGAIIVRTKDTLSDLPETHLVFTDLKLDANAQIPPNDMMDWMNGREGQFVLVNGQYQPKLTVNAPQRWRLWNMCNARYLNISGVPMTLVGTDGGLLSQPQEIESILLAPGERVEVVVAPVDQMENAVLTSLPYHRGKMAMGDVKPQPDPTIKLMDVMLIGKPNTSYVLPGRLNTITSLGAAKVTRQVMFMEQMDDSQMKMVNGRPTGMHFLINGKEFDMNRIDFTGQLGDIEEWEIINASDMDHPFHIHGTQFQVINRQVGMDTTAEPYLAWRDVVNVKPGQVVRLRFKQPNAGNWMFHCHILEHEDLGMMGIFKVA